MRDTARFPCKVLGRRPAALHAPEQRSQTRPCPVPQLCPVQSCLLSLACALDGKLETAPSVRQSGQHAFPALQLRLLLCAGMGWCTLVRPPVCIHLSSERHAQLCRVDTAVCG